MGVSTHVRGGLVGMGGEQSTPVDGGGMCCSNRDPHGKLVAELAPGEVPQRGERAAGAMCGMGMPEALDWSKESKMRKTHDQERSALLAVYEENGKPHPDTPHFTWDGVTCNG